MARLSDLVTDPITNQLSHTKLWNNVVNLVITYIVLDLHRDGKAGLDWILLYAAIVGTVGVASKLVSLRYGAQLPPEPASPTTPAAAR